MKKIIIACGAAAMLFAGAGCSKSAGTVQADSLNDSIAIFFGRAQGSAFADRIQSLPESEKEKFTKDGFLRGFKQMLMADTTDIGYMYGASVGLGMAQQLQAMHRDGLEVSAEELYRSFAAAFKADTTNMIQMQQDNSTLQQLMMRAQAVAQARRAEAQAAQETARASEATDNAKSGEAFVDSIKAADNTVKTTASGLSYKVVKEGTGATIGDNDVAKVHYTGRLINGEVFDSSVDRGEPVDFAVGQVVPGFGEGLKLMNKGAKYTFYIPANLAYGNNSVGTIPPGSTLVFDVEVLDITPAN
ncbi:FKBP-type peptidyl-prolyl cis-trans isomerase [uncultured Duncaniella sp.]|uniref:FKBP-type peptidyl-prolyl cis-trans isomerase n=1 Tax=uncultured Duncaniella sp. TaxID=2768039 RepID=UPI002657D83D|nr:FKBP-type peptidyl-prolyl cis-trans isomerase [uncultured Duncaniella sp.]